MRSILMALTFLVSSSAFAADSKALVCMMGDIANMDITIASVGDKQSIEVSLTSMDEDQPARVYKNSNFENSAITKSLAKGKFEAIVSKSDLEAVFGGAFLNAGIITMVKSDQQGRYDVVLSVENTVYTANCGE